MKEDSVEPIIKDKVYVLGKWVSRKKLKKAMQRYIYPSEHQFDLALKNKIDELCPTLDTVSNNKLKILDFIEKNNRRPSSHSKNLEERKLGALLSNYLRKYADFKNKINNLAPPRSTITKANKKAILEFAKLNKRRPSSRSEDSIEKKLGGNMRDYLSPSKSTYDRKFSDDLDKIVLPPNRKEAHQVEILNFISTNNRRPSYSSKDSLEKKLGGLLSNYLHKDKEFTLKLESIGFLPENTVDSNKENLLAMARNGEPRPKRGHKLASPYIAYTSKSHKCYDANFTKEIRKYWKKRDSSVKKEKLLAMAKNGDSRPKTGTSLRTCLNNYASKTSKSMYDANFTKEIRKYWPLEKNSRDKKDQLLAMARSGEGRPGKRKSILGMALTSYTNKGGCYDPEFDKQIRELRPDWFK